MNKMNLLKYKIIILIVLKKLEMLTIKMMLLFKKNKMIKK